MNDDSEIDELAKRLRDTEINDATEEQPKPKEKVRKVLGDLKLPGVPEPSIYIKKGIRKIDPAKLNAIRRKIFEDSSTGDSSPSKHSDDEPLPVMRKRGRKRCICSSDKWKKRRLEVRGNEERRRQKKRHQSKPCPSHADDSTSSLELEPRDNLLFPDPEYPDCLQYTPSRQLPFLSRNHPNVAFRQARATAIRRHLRPKRSRPTTSFMDISGIQPFHNLSDSDSDHNKKYRNVPISDAMKTSEATTEHETSDS